MVTRDLAKVETAGSSPVYRCAKKPETFFKSFGFFCYINTNEPAQFDSPKELLDTVRESGINIVSTANNHYLILDKNHEFMVDMLQDRMKKLKKM